MEPMKLLIGYDGSDHARGVLSDTRRAALPENVECIVLTASEAWASTSDVQAAELDDSYAIATAPPATRGTVALRDAAAIAEEGVEQLRAWHPHWNIVPESRADAPTWALLDRALEWRPDLLMVGTLGRGALSRVILGSVSQKVLAEATCSVRIARAPWTSTPAALRTIIALDSARDAMTTIRAAAHRSWPVGSAIHLLSALNLALTGYDALLQYINPADLIGGSSEELDALHARIDEATELLKPTGATITSEIRIGTAVSAILDVAQGWGADTIMVCARGHRFLDRLVLGSVSASLARRAGCSIEVVRPWSPQFPETETRTN
jgi:nucleotide-binding universal stress UspA family protein